MRTSNKILLTGFIVSLLIITGVYVTLYAKIRNGDLVVFNQQVPPVLEKHATPNIKHVLVMGLEECYIKFSDTARIELNKGWDKKLTWKVIGDSLIIEGSGDKNYAMGARVYVPVNVYLPGDVSVHARYSRVFVRGSDDSVKTFSRSVGGEHSMIFITPNSRGTAPVFWNKLTIASREGGATVSPGTVVQEMELTLSNNAAFSDEGADFINFSVTIDSTSTLSLRQRSLEKLKIIKP